MQLALGLAFWVMSESVIDANQSDQQDDSERPDRNGTLEGLVQPGKFSQSGKWLSRR